MFSRFFVLNNVKVLTRRRVDLDDSRYRVAAVARGVVDSWGNEGNFTRAYAVLLSPRSQRMTFTGASSIRITFTGIAHLHVFITGRFVASAQ
jgi:hypothetical protein